MGDMSLSVPCAAIWNRQIPRNNDQKLIRWSTITDAIAN